MVEVRGGKVIHVSCIFAHVIMALGKWSAAVFLPVEGIWTVCLCPLGLRSPGLWSSDHWAICYQAKNTASASLPLSLPDLCLSHTPFLAHGQPLLPLNSAHPFIPAKSFSNEQHLMKSFQLTRSKLGVNLECRPEVIKMTLGAQVKQWSIQSVKGKNGHEDYFLFFFSFLKWKQAGNNLNVKIGDWPSQLWHINLKACYVAIKISKKLTLWKYPYNIMLH